MPENVRRWESDIRKKRKKKKVREKRRYRRGKKTCRYANMAGIHIQKKGTRIEMK
jgi:hypothetical protein